MDEVLFRGTQKLESLQLEAGLVASKSKDLFLTYSQATQVLLSQVWQSHKLDHLKSNISQLLDYVLEISRDFTERAVDVADPKRLWMFLTGVLDGQWSKREISIACAGFVVGGLVGVAVGFALRRRENTVRYMEAVQISHYLGPESAAVVEDAIAPFECGDYEVLINVKAGSVHIIDAEICAGYGRTLRRTLRRLHKQSSSDLPVFLGRDCTGIITDLGRKVQRLELGDEVWVTIPFWSQGTLCQTILISEHRVARKPKNVGFEGACSVPYAGSLALSVLSEAKIDLNSAANKRFLIQDGCTPVGCVLIQLLNSWKAHITTTCHKRAVPVAKALGAREVISIDAPSLSDEDHVEEFSDAENFSKTVLKELQLKGEIFDFIIVTRNENLNWESLRNFCAGEGKLLSTLPEKLSSDSYGFLARFIFSTYIRLKFLMGHILGVPSNNYDEAHLCHATLDKLTALVEDGVLQTVVDKVFHPKDIEVALNYIQSSQSIGSSVITFR
uniref:Enoyl reductase (ER) domain-containing protein n=1 Tax=Dendroctonus ponderosae TaxID=77166 RepID=A0AAR5Q2S6_DENPD